jgi:hypothetical protein
MAGSLDELTIMADGSFAPVIRPTTYTAVRTLQADVAEYINVPTDATVAIFGSSGTFACRYNATQAGTAAAAFTDSTGGDTIEINPTQRRLYDITELSVIAKGDVYLSVTFYKD